jgi:hypothetical protein
MKIKIKREGGFIGITSKANLEFDELTPAEQNTFASLAQQSLDAVKPKEIVTPKIVELPMSSAPDTHGFGLDVPIFNEQGMEQAGPQMPSRGFNPNMRDGFSYSVSMRKDGKTMSMKFDDMSAPPEIVEIFQKYVQY